MAPLTYYSSVRQVGYLTRRRARGVCSHLWKVQKHHERNWVPQLQPISSLKESFIILCISLCGWGRGRSSPFHWKRMRPSQIANLENLQKNKRHMVHYEMCCLLFYVMFVLIYWRKRHQNIIGKIMSEVQPHTWILNLLFHCIRPGNENLLVNI